MACNFDGLLGKKGSFFQSSDISGVYEFMIHTMSKMIFEECNEGGGGGGLNIHYLITFWKIGTFLLFTLASADPENFQWERGLG